MLKEEEREYVFLNTFHHSLVQSWRQGYLREDSGPLLFCKIYFMYFRDSVKVHERKRPSSESKIFHVLVHPTINNSQAGIRDLELHPGLCCGSEAQVLGILGTDNYSVRSFVLPGIPAA